MDRKALPYYIPGAILFIWGVLWAGTGFYTSQALMVFGIMAAGALLLWLGQRIQQKANEDDRATFGDK